MPGGGLGDTGKGRRMPSLTSFGSGDRRSSRPGGGSGVRRAGVILAALAAAFIAAPVLAAVHVPTDCLPPRGGPPYNAPPYDGKYRTAEQVHADFPGLVVDQVEHTIYQGAGHVSPCNNPPTVPNVPDIESFNSNVSGNYSYLNGPSTPFSAGAPCQTSVTLVQTSGDTRTFQTEMLSMDISGGNLPSNVRLRESPTLQSTGQTRIRTFPKGGYVIDSFFDIFVEVSLDNGETWTPSTNGPTHVELTDPASVVPGVSIPGLALLVLLLTGAGLWVIRAGRAPARA